MAYRRKKPHALTGEDQRGTVLEIAEASEPIIRLTLEDGTLVRVKVSILEVMRMDEPDQNGNLVYDIQANLTSTFISPDQQLDG